MHAGCDHAGTASSSGTPRSATDPERPRARFPATYRPTGPTATAAPGTLEEWLTPRMRLFSADRAGRIRRAAIDHPRWPLQPADGQIDVSSIVAAHGLRLPDHRPHLLFAERLDVHAWRPVRD